MYCLLKYRREVGHEKSDEHMAFDLICKKTKHKNKMTSKLGYSYYS